MKKIFELVYVTSDNVEHNVLYADKDHANDMLKQHYFEGATSFGHEIKLSFIVVRILF